MHPVAFLLQAHNFYEASFARKISANQAAAWNLLCDVDLISCAQDLLCGTKFAPLRNDKIYGAI